jgi:CRISPR-associated protein (TIGR03986 family)
MPRHVNPISPNRTATAPYNFVPLPERVFDVAEGIDVDGKKIKPWEMHDCFVPGTYSGRIELSIETLTPLFIRGTVSPRDDGSWDDRDPRLRPAPYLTRDGRPAIPGSSLRGMVRTLVEILTFSKIQPVTAMKPFFRTVADDRIGRAYRNRMILGGQKPHGGILRLQDDGVTIEPREVIRVQRTALKSSVPFQDGPNYTPPWPQQHGRCWVKLEVASPDITDIRLQSERPSGSGWRAATLVLTGNSPKKKREFVFLEPDEPAGPAIRVPDNVWLRFHDDDQITNWQERAFPQNCPHGVRRKAPGHLRDGEPVFFLTDDQRKSNDNPDGLVFLGRAGMFRLPYDRSPDELIPEHLRGASLDLAEAMFGKAERSEAIKGRVHFEDAVALDTMPSGGWFERTIVPQILSSPKPTTFQHYLTQDATKGKDQLTTYLDGDRTTIRGHKIYWHRWGSGGDLSQVIERNDHQLLQDLRQANPSDTQHTLIRPVKAGVTFAGFVRFENLTELELGALLHALQLPEGCAHRLGMGKPLGLGSIRITARLKTIDRVARYRAWQPAGVEESDGNRFRSVFLEAILSHARASGETLLNGQTGLRQIARLDTLYCLLEWANRPSREKTEYMQRQMFEDRPVLPTPHGVTGSREPPWPPDAPRPAPDSAAGDSPRGGRSGRTTVRPSPGTDSMSRQRQVPNKVSQRKPIQAGQTRTGTLKRSDTGWVAVFEDDDREAQIVNAHKIDPKSSEGTTAEFYILEQSKRVGIRCRFERALRGT